MAQAKIVQLKDRKELVNIYPVTISDSVLGLDDFVSNSTSITGIENDISSLQLSLTGYATLDWTKTYVTNAIAGISGGDITLDGYATEEYVLTYVTNSLGNYVTTTALSNYASLVTASLLLKANQSEVDASILNLLSAIDAIEVPGAYDDTEIKSNISSISTRVGVIEADYVKSADIANFVSSSYVNQKISDLVNNAPAELDTLKEIADKLSDNDDVVASLTSQIASKASTSSVTALGNRVSTLETANHITLSDIPGYVEGLSFATINYVDLKVAEAATGGTVDLSNYIQKNDKVSFLYNDAGYITAGDLPTDLSDLTNNSSDPYVSWGTLMDLITTIRGNASTEYNSLGLIEAKIKANATAISNLSTSLGNYYTKDETDELFSWYEG